MPYRILIVDDEPDILSFLGDALRDEGYEPLTAETAEEALAQARKVPDLIILDVMLPGQNGFDLCPRLRKLVNCPILFLSARQSESDRIQGLAVGGDDYLVKPFGIRELKARVQAHLRREERQTRHEQTLLRYGDLKIDLAGYSVFCGEQAVNLTSREFEILSFLALHPGQVFSREQIYEEIWGLEAMGDNTTVTEHIKKIRGKLQNAACTGDYITTVWGIGYKWKSGT